MNRSTDEPMNRSPDVRVAVVGVGHLGRHHARVAASLPGVVLAGVHDHHEGRAEAVAREFGLSVLPDLSAVAGAADAVVVATPTASHAEIAASLLERGCDVFVEKPMTRTLAEADDLLARARAAGRVLQVGHVERYNPAVSAALARVEEPRFIESHRLGVFTRRSLDVDVVLDLMIHDLQIVQALVRREDCEIRAAGMPVLTQRIDIANARIAFDGGCVANVTASRVSGERLRKCRIFAPELYLSIDMQEQSVSAYRLSREKGPPEILPVVVPVERAEPLALELSDFVRCVRERAEPLVSGRHGREALALAQSLEPDVVFLDIRMPGMDGIEAARALGVTAAIEAHRRSVEGVPV
jgi:predicted dehydrogenase